MRAPMPRRGGVSGLPHRAAAAGLDEASVAAPALSRSMNAAVTARPSSQRREGNDLRTTSRTGHNDHTTPRQQAPRGHLPGSQPEAGDRVASPPYLALAGREWAHTHTLGSRRAPHTLDGVSQVDRSAVVAPSNPSSQVRARAPRDDRGSSGSVALHPLEGGGVEREHGQWFSGGSANDTRLGRSVSPGLALAGGADGARGAPVSRVRLLARVARGTVAEHIAALSRLLLTGPARVW